MLSRKKRKARQTERGHQGGEKTINIVEFGRISTVDYCQEQCTMVMDVLRAGGVELAIWFGWSQGSFSQINIWFSGVSSWLGAWVGPVWGIPRESRIFICISLLSVCSRPLPMKWPCVHFDLMKTRLKLLIDFGLTLDSCWHKINLIILTRPSPVCMSKNIKTV